MKSYNSNVCSGLSDIWFSTFRNIFSVSSSIQKIEYDQQNDHVKDQYMEQLLMDIYAMYERALLYDWALFKGKFSLTERSDKLLPHVLDTFVEGI